MDNHFLTEIEIEKFKCFSNFKAEGFKRVNLIGGKNNVGKTAFMEACYVNVSGVSVDHVITALIDIKFMRENVNLMLNPVSSVEQLDSTKHYSAISNRHRVCYLWVEGNAKKEYRLKIDYDDDFHINAKDISIRLLREDSIAFIDNFGWRDDELIKAYSAIQRKNKEDELNILIREFDNSIENFKIIGGSKPQCGVNEEYRDITEFGDGLKHYISIICALYACENGYLFIDEIGNGIHYTQHDKLWELILTLSKKTNCQVFAITHSKEMLESFARVAKKLDEQDISYTTLVKNKQQEIKAITQDCEMLIYSMSQEHEVR
jgi:AAA15 family ATPase/GTPase